MKILKILFIIGCIPLFAGDAFIVINAITPGTVPNSIVFPAVLLGLAGIICGIIYCKPQRSSN